MEYKRYTDLTTERLVYLMDKYEGATEEDITTQEVLELFSYLIHNGDCWWLNGWYGREARALIDSKWISAEGYILYQEKE